MARVLLTLMVASMLIQHDLPANITLSAASRCARQPYRATFSYLTLCNDPALVPGVLLLGILYSQAPKK